MASRQGAQRAKQRQARDRGMGVAIIVEGERYSVFTSDLSAQDSLALRRATGMSFRGLVEAGRTDPDIDIIAAVMWLARRLRGERGLAFETVASEFNYETKIELADADDEDEADEDGLPKA